MARRFEYLRYQMRLHGYDMTSMAGALGFGMQSLSDRMRNKTPWRMAEMWDVMGLLQQEPEDFYKLFPPGGVADSRPPSLQLLEKKKGGGRPRKA